MQLHASVHNVLSLPLHMRRQRKPRDVTGACANASRSSWSPLSAPAHDRGVTACPMDRCCAQRCPQAAVAELIPARHWRCAEAAAAVRHPCASFCFVAFVFVCFLCFCSGAVNRRHTEAWPQVLMRWLSAPNSRKAQDFCSRLAGRGLVVCVPLQGCSTQTRTSDRAAAAACTQFVCVFVLSLCLYLCLRSVSPVVYKSSRHH